MNQILCSIREAGEALSVSRSKIYELMDHGEIESVKIGQRRLILAESISHYVTSLTEGGSK